MREGLFTVFEFSSSVIEMFSPALSDYASIIFYGACVLKMILAGLFMRSGRRR